MITLVFAFDTEFHRELATQGWMESLRSHIEERIAKHRTDISADITGVVRSRYNEVRYMGPDSVVKYHFLVEVTLPRHDAPADPDKYESSVRYQAEAGTFETFHEDFDSKERRAKREFERRDAQRTRLLAQLVALQQLEREMEEFVSRSTQSGEQVGDENHVGAPIWERFARAVSRSCLGCQRDVPSTVYVVERS